MKALKVIGLLAILLAGQAFGRDDFGIRKVGQAFDFWSTAQDVEFMDNYAFVSTGATGLRVVDLSNPNDLRQVGSCDSYRNYRKTVRLGTMLYAAADGVVAVDVSDPLHPRERGSYDFPAIDIQVIEGYAFASYSARSRGIVILNISNPDSISLVSIEYLIADCLDLEISGNALYVTCEDWIFIYDVSDPTNLVCIARLDARDGPKFVQSEITDTLLYTQCADSTLRITNFSDVRHPVQLGSFDLGCTCQDIAIRDKIAYLVAEEGFEIWNLTDPQNPEFVGTNDSLSFGKFVSVHDDYAAIGNSYNLQLKLINIADPAQPTLLDSMTPYGRADKVAVEGNLACVIGKTDDPDSIGLWTLDITDPRNPRILGFNQESLLGELRCSQPIIRNSLIYVSVDTDVFKGLFIFDATDPTDPVQIGLLGFEERVLLHTLEDQRAFLHVGMSDIYVIDISNPHAPEMLANMQLPWQSGHLADLIVRGDIAITRGDRIDIWNIADLENPQYLSSINLGSIHSMASFGEKLYIIYEPRPFTISLMCVDISDPTNARSLGELITERPNTLGYGVMYADANHAYSGQSGLYVCDVTDPTRMRITGKTDLPGFASSLVVQDEMMYAANSFSLGIYDCSEALDVTSPLPFAPYTLQLDSPFPNPFNSTTTITFGLSKLAPTRVGVFDPLGRRVAELIPTRVMSAGEYRVHWDASGVAAGNYFVKLQGGAEELSRRITLVK